MIVLVSDLGATTVLPAADGVPVAPFAVSDVDVLDADDPVVELLATDWFVVLLPLDEFAGGSSGTSIAYAAQPTQKISDAMQAATIRARWCGGETRCGGA
ncbi:MAG: hypothetical protein AAFP90_13420 [Planctomycetota bacterium]